MHSDGKNRKTLYLVMGTMGVAALALGLLMQFGKAKNTVSNANPTKNENGSENLPVVKKNLIPDTVSQSEEVNAPNLLSRKGGSTPAGTAKGFDYESPNDEGKLELRVRGGTTEPLPNGLIRIPDPQAWVYPADDRFVYITADEAEIEGTEMDPEAGTLIGHVRIRVFAQDQSSGVGDIRSLDIESTTITPIAEMTAERVHFDRATNQITTAEHFVLKTDKLAVAGRGLSTVFNEIDNRIEHLRIDERESIVFSTAEGSSAPLKVGKKKELVTSVDSPSHTRSPDQSNINTTPHDQSASTPASQDSQKNSLAAETEPAALPYYRIVLSQGVTVVQLSNGESVSISGDTLSAELSLDSSDENTLFSSGMNVSPYPGDDNHRMNSFMDSPLLALPANSRRSTGTTLPVRPSTVTRAGLVLAAAALSLAQPTTQTLADVPQVLSEVDFSSLALPLGMVTSESIINQEMIIVLGSGPLEILPLLNKPDQLSGRDDIFGTIDGSPVTLQSKDGSAVCTRVEYHQTAEIIALYANHDVPVTIHLADGGIARTHSPVELNSGQNTVRFLGAGTFDNHLDENKNAPVDHLQDRSTPGRIDFAGGVSAQWSDSVTITFDGGRSSESIANQEDITNNTNGSLGKIKSAEFRGQVRFEHSGGYTLEADRLFAMFDDYHGVLEEPAISLLTGTGHVRVYSREGEVSGDQLDVSFALDKPLGVNQDPQPTVVEFSQHVKATDTHSTLHADYLRINLYKPSELAALDSAADDENRVRLITATNHVSFDLDGGGKAVGDRLVVNQRDGTATLSGKSVIVSKDTMRIVAPQIDLDRKNQTVRIVGAGVMTYLDLGDNSESGKNRRLRDSEDVWQEIRRRLDREGDQEDSETQSSNHSKVDSLTAINDTPVLNNNDTAQAVRIHWQKEMTFNDASGYGEFLGGVLAETAAKVDEYNSIQADRLIFRLTQPIALPTVASADRAGSSTITGGSDSSSQTSPSEFGLLNDRSAAGGRRLIEMTATSESDTPAKIQAVRYSDSERTTPVSIFYISGPILEYFATTKRLTVTGSGSMFLYDGRPDSSVSGSSNNNNDNTTIKNSKIRFSGHGRTLFKWTGSLTLNGIEQSMTILDDVSVRHRSPGHDDAKSTGALDMWCQSLRSSMETGANDVDVLSMSGQATGQLKMLDAGGSIFIVSESREISASHLHFESTTQLAVLSGSIDSPVTVTKTGSPNSFEAERVFWDLYEDSITVEHPGAATMPTGGP